MRRPLLFACVCIVAAIYLYMCIFNPPPWDVSGIPESGEYAAVTGQIYQKESRISYGKKQTIYYLQNITFSGQSSHQAFQSRIRCELQQNTDLPMGAYITVQGIFEADKQAGNPGEFDAALYYGGQNICGRITAGQLTHMGKSFWRIREGLFQWKSFFTKRLIDGFGEEDGGIFVKMLLGDGSLLDKDIKELYQANGIVHILSISGMHISMLGMGLYRLLRRCRVNIYISSVCGGIFILLYGMMIGFGLSAVRAIGMYLIHLLGIIWGKGYDMLTAMGVILVTMVIDNPKILFHAGFLLSFGCVCALGLLQPRIQEYIPRFSSLMVSLSVTIFTLPIQLYYFYKIPLYSAFLNLLILPFLSVVMIVGILVMLFPFLHKISFLGSFVLRWYEILCRLFEYLPVHTVYTGCPPVWKIVVFYIGLMCFIWVKPTKGKRWFILIPVLLTIFLSVQKTPPLRIVMMDVGQGDGILVQTRQRTVLIDGGSSSKNDVGKYQMAGCLAYYGVDYLDAVIITHPDGDHMNGLIGLLESGYENRVGHIFLPDIAAELWQQEFQEVYALAAAYEIPVSYMGAGDEFFMEDVQMKCLHPEKKSSLTEGNAYSQVYYLTYGEFSMLLAGDVEGEGEAQLLKELRHQNISVVTVLKVAHHGSKYSTGSEFLSRITPKLALISCGENNSYGHPHEETLQRLTEVGCKILTTPEWGAITIEVDKDISVYGWKRAGE